VQLEAQTGNPVEDLAAGNVPRGDFEAAGVWSLLNLILSLICLIAFILLLVSAIRKRDVQTSAKLFRVFATAMAAVTVVVWVLLDKLQMPTAWLDQYSPIIIALFAVFAIATAAFRISRNHEDKAEAPDSLEVA
jgi:Ca2+/Na+ antiporter